MKLPHRRRFLHLAAGAAAAFPVFPRFAKAQAYPSRPVRLIVGSAAGGSSDLVGRVIGQWLSERLGATIHGGTVHNGSPIASLFSPFSTISSVFTGVIVPLLSSQFNPTDSILPIGTY